MRSYYGILGSAIFDIVMYVYEFPIICPPYHGNRYNSSKNSRPTLEFFAKLRMKKYGHL